MTDTSKIKIAATIGAVIIVIMFIFMVLFVQNNKETGGKKTSSKKETSTVENKDNKQDKNEKNKDNENSEDNIDKVEKIDILETYSFGIKENKLVAISKDLSFQDMTDIEAKFIDIDTENPKIYLLNYASKITIDEIDFEKATKTRTIEIDGKYVENSFGVYNQNLYWSTGTGIYKYDLEKDEGEEIIKANDNETFLNCKLDKQTGYIYFMKNTLKDDDYETAIYRANLQDYTQEEVLTAVAQGQELLLYIDYSNNNYLICNVLVENDSVNYFYHINSRNAAWEIGTKDVRIGKKAAEGNIAFTTEFIAFSDGSKIKLVDYDGNLVNENLYAVEDGSQIYDISMLTENIMQVRLGKDEKDITKTYLIDFEKSTINETKENYSNIVIK